MRNKLEVSGGLMLAMLGSGLLLVPLAGWMPLLAVAAACGTSMYLVKQLNDRR